jgi:predicted alpha/beta-fold hydrolase
MERIVISFSSEAWLISRKNPDRIGGRLSFFRNWPRGESMSSSEVPSFQAHRFLPTGHLQTIISRYLPGPPTRLASVDRRIRLDDGDEVVIHDSTASGWSPGQPMVLLVHGLGGDASGIELVKLGARLFQQGIRVVRINLRGAGPGFGLARKLYSGASYIEVRAVAEWMVQNARRSPLALVGFSLGGNLVLNVAAEAASRPLEGLDCVLAAGAPIDLASCARWMDHPSRRFYDRQFLYTVIPEVRRLHARFPELGRVDLGSVRSMLEFDRCYTAPRNGFSSVETYHQRCSPVGSLHQIEVPGLVVHARDDPFIPLEPFLRAQFPPSLELEILGAGGHLGFISRKPWAGDRRWLVSRMDAWLAKRWNPRS